MNDSGGNSYTEFEFEIQAKTSSRGVITSKKSQKLKALPKTSKTIEILCRPISEELDETIPEE